MPCESGTPRHPLWIVGSREREEPRPRRAIDVRRSVRESSPDDVLVCVDELGAEDTGDEDNRDAAVVGLRRAVVQHVQVNKVWPLPWFPLKNNTSLSR